MPAGARRLGGALLIGLWRGIVAIAGVGGAAARRSPIPYLRRVAPTPAHCGPGSTAP